MKPLLEFLAFLGAEILTVSLGMLSIDTCSVRPASAKKTRVVTEPLVALREAGLEPERVVDVASGTRVRLGAVSSREMGGRTKISPATFLGTPGGTPGVAAESEAGELLAAA